MNYELHNATALPACDTLRHATVALTFARKHYFKRFSVCMMNVVCFARKKCICTGNSE